VPPEVRGFAALLLVPLCACAHLAPLDRADSLRMPSGQFVVRYAPRDAAAAGQVELAAARAAPRLLKWGRFEAPVTIFVEPGHEALEAAVDRGGYGWLRAWARYRRVWVQSPRTWSVLGAQQATVDELLLHELTHCLMYQLAGTRDDWMYKGIPLWFREGMASFTAEQGYRRGTLEELRRFERTHGDDPLADAEALYQSQSEVVYAAAHQAFVFLVERYGVEKVRALLAGMRGGLSFDAAFPQAIGIGRRAFERDFTNYVRLRGFAATNAP